METAWLSRRVLRIPIAFLSAISPLPNHNKLVHPAKIRAPLDGPSHHQSKTRALLDDSNKHLALEATKVSLIHVHTLLFFLARPIGEIHTNPLSFLPLWYNLSHLQML